MNLGAVRIHLASGAATISPTAIAKIQDCLK